MHVKLKLNITHKNNLLKSNPHKRNTPNNCKHKNNFLKSNPHKRKTPNNCKQKNNFLKSNPHIRNTPNKCDPTNVNKFSSCPNKLQILTKSHHKFSKKTYISTRYSKMKSHPKKYDALSCFQETLSVSVSLSLYLHFHTLSLYLHSQTT